MNLNRIIYTLVLAWIPVLLPVYAQVYINEVMASNATIIADPEYGNFSDWIELYNPGAEDVDLSGYFLSDDPGNPTMWEFQSGTILPQGEYLLVYADGTGYGLHSNFKLAGDGEPVLLYNPQNTLIDSISYPELPTNISFGRNPEHLSELGYLVSPTPGEANGNQFFEGISSTPHISLEGGFYSGPQSLVVSVERQSAAIHYTLDGTEPDLTSPLFPAQLDINETTVLRVRSFEPGYFTGPAITRSYFIDEAQNLPIVSLVTDPDHFFDDETGIYVEGTAGVPGYCTSVPHNVNQDWERPVNIELFEKDGTIGLNQVAGVKIFGGCSRVRFPIKSLGFYARKEYGTADFKYRLFPDKPSENYETFILRAAADDQPFSLFRDGLAQMLVKDVIDVDVQAYRPVVVYINGAYWGIHNLREKINEHYANDNFGVNSDSVDVLKRNPEKTYNVVSGNADHYNAMMQYLKDNDITQNVHYEYMSTQMDMNEYINYQITQIFFGGRDWPGNNIKFWRSREAPYNKWRWVLYDLDHVFKEYFSDIMDAATDVDCGCTWPNPPWSTYLFRTLLENESFRHEFTQRFARYSNTHFSRERIHRFIDEMQAALAPEIPHHIERWGGQKTNLPDNTWVSPIFNSVEEWEYRVQVIRDFTDTRHEIALKHLNDYFGTSGFVALDTRIDPTEAGILLSAGIEMVDSTGRVEYLEGEKITVSVEAEHGFLFSQWEIHNPVVQDTSLIKKGDLWSYLISKETPEGWTSTAYDDELWPSGNAQLGYGNNGEVTEIGYGGNPDNKYITTWFRKKFSIADSTLFKRYTLKLVRDDGARVFLNGMEVIRDNMQRWSVGASSTAQETVGGEDESRWFNFGLNPSLFRQGENVLAVEIHQASVSSSDMSFDLELVARELHSGTRDTIYSPQLSFDLIQDTEITARMIADTNTVADVYINEIMASNDAGLTDELGEFEDWVELYNAGAEAMDLGGLYLADTFPAISPWQFPSEQPELTTLQPGAFLVIYADANPSQGQLHADFKLSKDGEEIVLMQKIGADTMLIDHLAYNFQVKNISFGRFPDGSPVMEHMTQSTPGTPNAFEITLEESIPETGKGMKVYPVPSHGTLFINLKGALMQEDIPVEVSVYSIRGAKVLHSRHHTSSLIKLSLDDLNRGMYIIQVQAGERLYQERIILH